MQAGTVLRRGYVMRAIRIAARVLRAVLLLVAAAWSAGCTTSVQPVQCQGGPYRCNVGFRDVKFCEDEAVAVAGAGCTALGLAPSRHFCIVKPEDASCADTRYELKGLDCQVSEYRPVREWRECSEGTPTFAP
jgi:hypothetical protein